MPSLFRFIPCGLNRYNTRACLTSAKSEERLVRPGETIWNSACFCSFGVTDYPDEVENNKKQLPFLRSRAQLVYPPKANPATCDF